ncbi:hypothetical protein VZT92_019724 [Zoarces viviparus]|uniref:DUF6729 domain-containing protein n=1 Tax=Zoarces viviparus TaxID=48416 RepID=A0AAW1ELB5_ZOAVI
MKKVEEEERDGTFNPHGNSKDSLLSFLDYSRSFQEIEELREYLFSRKPAPPVASEGDNVVGFGTRAKDTWRQIWESRADGYAAFILGVKCIKNSRMFNLQQYILQQQSAESCPPPAEVSATSASATPTSTTLVMEEDEELEREMLNMSPSKYDTGLRPPAAVSRAPAVSPSAAHGTKSTATATVHRPAEPDEPLVANAPVKAKAPLPVPPQLLALAPQLGIEEQAPNVLRQTPPVSVDAPHQPAASVPGYDQDVAQWNCSQQQRLWMKSELEVLGLWPGSRPVRHPMNMLSLWRHPPQPELIDSISELPSPKYFQLHPFFIWKPEHTLMERVRNNYILPCLHGCPNPQVASSGIGRPRVIIGTSGQYYILASRLTCKGCRKYWHADKPQWLEKLPQRFRNIVPAFLTHKKAVCRSVMDEMRRSGRSPEDMSKQLTEALHLKYERAHLAYLLSVQNVRDAETGVYGQRTITGLLRQADTPAHFGGYADADGWCGVSMSSHYLVDCLVREYQRQEQHLTLLLQGTFGQALRSDDTRKVARKVVLSSGTMSSYAIMNENWMILSWVMLQSECDRSLYPMYEGLCQRYTAAGVEKARYQWVDRDCCAAFTVLHPGAQEHVLWDSWRTSEATVAEATSGNLANTSASRTQYNKDITIKLNLFHCMRRFTRECVSEHHSLYSSFCQFLSAAFLVVDQADLQKLKEAYTFCNISPANPTKQHIREHCRIKVPQPRELLQRVEDVLHHFYLAKDANDLLLFKASMLKIWRIQRVHILRGCLSDPELNYNKGEGAAVPIWIPVRGTSQQEGFHFHQAQWVSCELFQAQAMTGVACWNFQRLVDLKLPGVELPVVFDPLLVAELNVLSAKVTAKAKYPTLQITNRDTGERFGLHYVEPGCRPVLLNWDKNKAQTNMAAAVAMETKHHCSAAGEGRDRQETSGSVRDATVAAMPILSCQQWSDTVSKFQPPSIPSSATAPLPVSSSPRATRTGPIEAGGLVQVLDHGRWTEAMRAAIDGLLGKHHRAPRMLKRVDEDYAAMVQRACTDPNSLFHLTTCQHISRYVKHLAKLKNTSSSLNTSPEKILETQQLWQSLTTGSQTVSVPVTTLPPATLNPPPVGPPPPVAPPQEESLSRVTVEKIVAEILEKQQQQQQQLQQKKTTRNCLACGQHKSRYLGDGSSVHFFFQSPTVKYFYCSTKVFKCYAGEGLKDPRMSFEDFAASPFFERELEAAKQRGAEWRKVAEERKKRESALQLPTGRLCRFCHQPLKQGPSSPHVHSSFPEVSGKYIYCPSKVFSLYKDQGMVTEMTWGDFSQSNFYEAERERWIAERK